MWRSFRIRGLLELQLLSLLREIAESFLVDRLLARVLRSHFAPLGEASLVHNSLF